MGVRVEGLKGVLDTLRQLPPEVSSKRGGPVAFALRRAAKVIQQEARSNVRKVVAEPNKDGRPSLSTGALERSISIKRRRSTQSGQRGEAFSVGPGRLSKKVAEGLGVAGRLGRNAPFYAWFLEFGTARMRPHPFMRPAYESKKQEALIVIVRDLQLGIERALNKLKRKNRVQG